MRPVPEITDLDLAFPTTKATPPKEEIPEEFWRTNPWSTLANRLRWGDLPATDLQLVAVDPAQPGAAWRAIRECMGSWAFSDNHKEAALGYLLSEWFKDYWIDGDTKTRILGEDLDPDFIAAVAEMQAAGKNTL